MMSQISFEQAREDIDRGIAADEMALNGASSKTPSKPFFRFPYFDSTSATLDLLQSRGIRTLGTGCCPGPDARRRSSLMARDRI